MPKDSSADLKADIVTGKEVIAELTEVIAEFEGFIANE
jgi:hypothetical protein